MSGPVAEPRSILFVLHNPGFVRHYESTLAALADQGHTITISFNLERNKLGEQVQIERLLERCPGISLVPMPEPTLDRWHYLAVAVRLLQDYGRYFDPLFEAATALRERAAAELPPALERLCRICCRFKRLKRAFVSGLRAAERAIPLNAAIHDFLRELAPDVLLITPLVDWGSDQVDCLKSAEALGIPSALCVASWDNLTNKGSIRYAPTRVIVWNAAQQREAVELHDVPASRVVVTGAQTFDHWFTRRPSKSREAFCAQLGLDPGKPILLYLGSSFFIAPDEAQFFDRFLRAMRRSGGARLQEAGVVVRPHPLNIQQWLAFDYSGLGSVAVFPTRADVEAFTESFRADFFDSLFHAAVAVGVNTSAMIEAGIVGRPVFTIRAPEFSHSQEGTIHFKHLTDESGGVARSVSGIDEACEAIGHALSDPERYRAQTRRYIEAFVRPNGWDTPASEHLQRAILGLAAARMPVEHRRTRRLARMALAVPSLCALGLLRPKAKPITGPLGPVQGTTIRAAFVLLLYVVAPMLWAKQGVESVFRWLRLEVQEVSEALGKRLRAARRVRREVLHRARLAYHRIFTREWLMKQYQQVVVKPGRRGWRRIDDATKVTRQGIGRAMGRAARRMAQARQAVYAVSQGVVRRAMRLVGPTKP